MSQLQQRNMSLIFQYIMHDEGQNCQWDFLLQNIHLESAYNYLKLIFSSFYFFVVFAMTENANPEFQQGHPPNN